MNTLLENAIITFAFSWSKSHLAKATLNIEKIFEVRYFRITMREDGSVYFQPPALQIYGWKDCFVILDKKDWYQFSDKVIKEFYVALKQQEEEGQIPQPILDKLNSFKEQELSENDLDKIAYEIEKQSKRSK